MKILFVSNLPAPYRVDFFNRLGKYCDLTVCFERGSSTERNVKWENKTNRNYKEIFCKARLLGVDKTIGLDLVKKVKQEKFDHLIISGYASPSVIFLILYCQRKKIPYFIETDGGFYKKDKFFSGLIKKKVLKKAKGIFTTCDELVKYYKEIEYKGEIYKYPISSIWNEDIFKQIATDLEKTNLRKEIGIREKNVVITVGRFSYKNGYGKGYDKILQAAQILKENSIAWLVIGGEPSEEFVEMKKTMGLDNVYFIDFKQKEELKKYYRLSDVFVLMTVKDVWGMVINEAMSCGLPVITTDKCIAGLELIQNGENGYIVPVGDSDALAEKVNELIKNDKIREKMSKNNLEKIKLWTIESMVKKHLDVLGINNKSS